MKIKYFPTLARLHACTLALLYSGTLGYAKQLQWHDRGNYTLGVGTIDDTLDPLWAYFYIPQSSSPVALVIVLPILGGQNLWIENQFVHSLIRRKIACVQLILPEQFWRKRFPEISSGLLFLSPNPSKLASNFLRAQQDIVELFNFLDISDDRKLRDAIDKNKIGILGVSLGGILGSLTMAQEQRLKAGAFLLAGSDPAHILLEGRETRAIAKTLNIDYATLAQNLKAIDLSAQQPRFNDRPVLLVEASWDRVIPKQSRQKLRQAIPGAQWVSLPAGHYSSLLYIFWMKHKVAKFFQQNLQ